MTNEKYQFGHIQTYPRSVSKKRKEGLSWAISDIVAEASRMTEASLHVLNPKPPVHIFGIPISDLELAVEQQIKDVHMLDGRALRKDSHVLLACVYSWPENSNSFDQNRFKVWQADILKFHESEFKKVECAVLHLDEAFPHLHVYTVSSDARALHPGWIAKKRIISASEKLGNDKKASLRDGNKAYREAMKYWQDRYFIEVGQLHAFERFGPRRRRIDRKDHLNGKKARLYDAELRINLRESINQKLLETGEAHEIAKQTLISVQADETIIIIEKEKAKKDRELANKLKDQALLELNSAKSSAAKLAPWLKSSNIAVAMFWKVVKQFNIEPEALKQIRQESMQRAKELEKKHLNSISELQKKLQFLDKNLNSTKDKLLKLSQHILKLEKENQSLSEKIDKLEQNNHELALQNNALQPKSKIKNLESNENKKFS